MRREARLAGAIAILLISSVITLAPTPAAAVGGAADWTQFGFDASHDGFNPYETKLRPRSLRNLHQLFSFNLNVLSSTQLDVVNQPVVAGGIMYANAGGGVYAVDAVSGQLLWHHQGCGPGPLNMPAVAAGQVWTGGPTGAITRFDARTGAAACVTSPGSGGRVNPPAVVGETVFITDQQGNLYAINAATGHFLFGAALNQQPLNAPAYDTYTKDLYISTGRGLLYRVDATKGTVVWVKYLSGGALNDELLTATAAGPIVLVPLNGDALVAMDAKTGRVIWLNQVNCGEGGSYLPASVAYSLAFQDDPDCGTYAFNLSTGDLVWIKQHARIVGDAPITVANNVLYPGGRMLRARSGLFVTAPVLPGVGNVTVVNGTVYTIAQESDGTYSALAFRT